MENTGSGNRRLGRGLASLFGEDADGEGTEEEARQGRDIPIGNIYPGRFQPRRIFDEDELDALAESIREKGILQPLLLRPDPDRAGSFEIIAGERRWRAAQRAELQEVPARIRSFDDREALEIAIVENVQREDLGPLEEAEGYQRLIREYGHSQSDVARAVGKSRSHVANSIRLMTLPVEVRTHLDAGNITTGHARALLTAEDPAGLVSDVIRRKLNVRETERLVRREKQSARQNPRKAASEDGASSGEAFPAGASDTGGPDQNEDTKALAQDLSLKLGMQVELACGADSRTGALTIRYENLEQLDILLAILSTPRTVQVSPELPDAGLAGPGEGGMAGLDPAFQNAIAPSAMTNLFGEVPDFDAETAHEIAKADNSSIDFNSLAGGGKAGAA